MVADFFTKPLQSEQFRILRAYIMGWRPMPELLIQKDKKRLIESRRMLENVWKPSKAP